MLKIKDIEKYIDDPLLDSIFREREEELYIECKNEDEDLDLCQVFRHIFLRIYIFFQASLEELL